MHLSSLPVSFYRDFREGRRSLDGWFRFAASLGLDGADVSVAHLSSRHPADLAALRRLASNAGIAVAIVAAYPDFIHPDGAAREREVDDVRRWIDAAVDLGASAVRVTAGQQRDDVSEEDGVAWASAGLAASAEAAQGSGVRVLYENHVRGAHWDRADFTQRAARFLEVVRRTKGSGLDVLFDTANNLALDEDPAAVLEAVVDRVAAVHLSDLVRRGAFEPTVIGTGVAPIEPLVRRLVASGFDGWVSVEEASGTGEEGFRRGVAFADAVWTRAGGPGRTTTGQRARAKGRGQGGADARHR